VSGEFADDVADMKASREDLLFKLFKIVSEAGAQLVAH
jgi:hypothetical protein